MNLYPYTDFHELNDDWIIGHIKKNEKDIAALQNTIVNLNFEFDRKADKATTYTKTEVDTLLLGKADVSDIPDMSNYYDKSETNTLLANKANKATTLAGYGITDAYTKNEVNTSLANKADKATTLAGYGITDAYTKSEVDNIVNPIKWKRAEVVYSNLENNSSSGYYVMLDSDILSTLNATRILSATVIGFNGFGSVAGIIPNIVLDVDGGRATMPFIRGTIFSGASMKIRYIYE